MIPRPDHAYVPGRNARHAEDAFDPVKAEVTEGMGAADLARTRTWEAGQVYYREGFYWECHEVLEAVWMALPEGDSDRGAVQGLIQLANARLKLRMDKPRAARRLCALAEEAMSADAPVFDLSRDWLLAETRGIRAEAESAEITKDAQ
ncbi:DUF309 domain-containing protein [Aquicoccus sp. SCR17]|nr:DUF309 domain-containing protein [Carideicomes alvinocaridis]